MKLRVALLLALALQGCGNAPGESEADDRLAEGPLAVVAVNQPLATFAERIGGDAVEVVMPAPAGVDPAFWMPSPESVAVLQGADLILENGAGYARWLQFASLPRRARVDSSAAFHDRLIARSAGVTHTHGPEGDHSHAEQAFTVWLDPSLAILQARAIAAAFAARRPEGEAEFRSRLAALERELEALDQRLSAATGPLQGEPLLFSHPVYGYFARRYQLEGASLHWEPGVLPGPAEWRRLEAMQAEQPVRILFFEGAPHPEAEARLREMGIRTIVVDPGAARVEGGDWLGLMGENAARIEAVSFDSSSEA